MTVESSKPIVHFAHANGFPSGSYRQMFTHLGEDYQLVALDKFAHSEAYPVAQGWQLQVDEMLKYIRSQTDQPVFAVGHSFGAVVSYMAVCQHPELFRGLIMLDPPLITGLTRWIVKAIKPTPLFDKFTPAKQAMTRRTKWQKNTDLMDYFSAKSLFKDMQPECIQDYIHSAIEENESGFSLTFDHKVEAKIFRTIPLDINRYYGRLIKPALLVTGSQTQVCRPKLIAPFIKHNKIKHIEIKGGGHMFPLEQPAKTAEVIKQQLSEWH